MFNISLSHVFLSRKRIPSFVRELRGCHCDPGRVDDRITALGVEIAAGWLASARRHVVRAQADEGKMLESIEDHEWIETPTWRWCRSCGAYQKRDSLYFEWKSPVAADCPGTPVKSTKVSRSGDVVADKAAVASRAASGTDNRQQDVDHDQHQHQHDSHADQTAK